MHQLLVKLFQKRNIVSVDELSDEEKKQFYGWNAILSDEPVSAQQIETFCRAKIGAIEEKWSDLSLDASKKADLIPYHTAYRALLGVISTPKTQKEELERYLQTLL